MHLFFGQFRFCSLLLHDVTRCFRRVCKKKPYKNRVFLTHPLARCRRNRKKKKKKKGKGPKKIYTQILGGLENGQEVVPPFFPKKSGFFFQNPQKPYFYSVSRKNGWQPFFFKGYVTRRTLLEGQKKMITFWCLLDIHV